ncbi:MAG: twin-arginine translocation signal domain-containing protein, partial [Xanthobacteraceae bacterium]
MSQMERRAFMKGAAGGALAFTVGGIDVLLSPAAARAQGVPLRTLTAAQAATLEALGETLVPGARQAGIAHFVDQQ